MEKAAIRRGLFGLAAMAVVIPVSVSAVSSSELSLRDSDDRIFAEALHKDAEASGVSSERLAWQNEFSDLTTSYSMDPAWQYSYSEIVSPGEAVLAFGGHAPDGLEKELTALGDHVTVLEHTGFTELGIQAAASRAAQAILGLGATSVLAIPDARDRTITVSFSGVRLGAAEFRRAQDAIEDDVLGGGLAAAGFSVDFEESEAEAFVADALAIAE